MSFAKNSYFVIPIFFKPGIANHFSNIDYLTKKVYSLKYLRSMISRVVKIQGRIRKSEFVANTQFGFTH